MRRNLYIDPLPGIEIACQYTASSYINDVADYTYACKNDLYKQLLDFVPDRHVGKFKKQFDAHYGE